MANDKGSIGGKDTAGKNDWDVNSDGNMIPGTDNARSIGKASYRIAGMFANFPTTDPAVSGALWVSGAIVLQSAGA